jgi:hypothetical protein
MDKKCTKCRSGVTKKFWFKRWKQRWKCNDCLHVFQNKSRKNTIETGKMWDEYSNKRQTYEQSSQTSTDTPNKPYSEDSIWFISKKRHHSQWNRTHHRLYVFLKAWTRLIWDNGLSELWKETGHLLEGGEIRKHGGISIGRMLPAVASLDYQDNRLWWTKVIFLSILKYTRANVPVLSDTDSYPIPDETSENRCLKGFANTCSSAYKDGQRELFVLAGSVARTACGFHEWVQYQSWNKS